MAEFIHGRDLRIGDELAVLGSCEPIIRFDPHPGLDGATARVAVYEVDGQERGITTFDDDDFVRELGVVCPRHHWSGPVK